MGKELYIINKDKKGLRKLRPSIQNDAKLSGTGRKAILVNQKTVNRYKASFAPPPVKKTRRKKKGSAKWTRHKLKRYYNHPY